jgi:hypothetical protein
MGSLPPVAWENDEYSPTKGTLYLKAVTLGDSSVQAELGDTGMDENVGVYQVDVVAPAGTGKNAGMVMTDLIGNHFKRGTYLTYNDRTVRIENVNSSEGIIADGWYTIPVSVNWIAYTQARA